MRSEFQFINDIKKRFLLDRVGDDCAVVPKNRASDLLITADLLIENVDFRLEWATPEQIGHKALAVSLSDIAAMGGTPTFGLVSIGVPQELWDSGFPDGFYQGWHELAARFDVEMIGGDTSKSPDRVVIDSIVLGDVPVGRAILRSGARPGDAIFVSGSLGGAAGGLTLLENGKSLSDSTGSESYLIERQLRPFPQVELGKRLMKLAIATSMIDLSDGLSSDLAHICEASGVGAAVIEEVLPIDQNLSEHFGGDESFEFALHGGEDFELLFTVPEDRSSELKELPVTRVGTITTYAGKVDLIRGDAKTELEPKGYRHF
jgi:thiamine-monophosphate kinase